MIESQVLENEEKSCHFVSYFEIFVHEIFENEKQSENNVMHVWMSSEFGNVVISLKL